jgi:hypothetical protein
MTTHERRDRPRFSGEGVCATLRLGYRFGRVKAMVLDFNRHGMSVVTDRPLPRHGTVDLALACGPIRIDGLVGVIHNCRGLPDGSFRCGVQFRTDSRNQFDRTHIRAALHRLEELLAGASLETPAAH